jgi:ABC-type sugar transport system ATPase subunit
VNKGLPRQRQSATALDGLTALGVQTIAHAPATTKGCGREQIATHSEQRRAIKQKVTQGRLTTLVVTHDFIEAAYLADGVAVLNDNGLVYGQTEDLYRNPPDLATALILGRGNRVSASNFRDEITREQNFPLTVRGGPPRTVSDLDEFFFRPERLEVATAAEGFRVIDNRFVGENRLIRLRAPYTGLEIEAVVPAAVLIGDHLAATIDARDILVFDQQGRRRQL